MNKQKEKQKETRRNRKNRSKSRKIAKPRSTLTVRSHRFRADLSNPPIKQTTTTSSKYIKYKEERKRKKKGMKQKGHMTYSQPTVWLVECTFLACLHVWNNKYSKGPFRQNDNLELGDHDLEGREKIKPSEKRNRE